MKKACTHNQFFLLRHFVTTSISFFKIAIGAVFIIGFSPLISNAQQPVALKITGTVKNTDNESIQGVKVGIKGTQTAVLTNAKGAYTITAKPDAVLVFEHVGYTTKETAVNNSKVIDMVMSAAISDLDEVIVVGYGTEKRKDVTGTVARVTMNDLTKAPVGSFDQALAGRVAGVQVSSGDGQPGAGYTIVIRGNNSLTQDNSPLYVVDGFPVENYNSNALDPADIESIDILKDASATAIYGARGANGVIVITTKKGKVGTPLISYNASYGILQKPKEIPLMDGYEFVKLQLETSSANAAMYLNNGKTLESYRGIKGTDWQDAVLRDGNMMNHYLSISGGNANTRYSISGSVMGQKGVVLNSGIKRYQGRITLDQTINKKAKVGINVNYSYINTYGTVPSQTSFTATTNLMFSVWGYRPVPGYDTVDLANADFDPAIAVGSGDNRYNPLSTVNNQYRNIVNNNLFVNAYAEYAFSPNLRLRITGGITNNMQRNEAFNTSKTLSGDPRLSSTGPNGSIINNPVNSWLNENTLTYKKTFNKNNVLNAVGGITFQQVDIAMNGVSAIQVPNESLGIYGLDEGVPQTVTSTRSYNTLASFLARVNYSYKERYLFTVSARADGSSKFFEGHKWGYFPSAAFAWRTNKEAFMKKFKFLSDAKLRVTYGVTGNNRVSDFAYRSIMNINPAIAYSFNNQTPSQGIIPYSIGNPDLKWESTSQVNIGYDIGLWKDRVSISIDAYQKNTNDLLLNAQIPTTTGFQTAYKNVGKVRNSGLEFTLNTVNIRNKKFSWTSSFNISFNGNEVLALNSNQESLLSTVAWDNNYDPNPLYLAKLGQPISQMYGYLWQGNYQYSDFDVTPSGSYVLKTTVADNGNARNTIQPGDIKYKDINGDGTITPLDATVIGRTLPIHTGGFTNNFSYGNFDLNLFLQWSYGNDIFNANRLIFEGTSISGRNQFATYANRWSATNQNNELYRTGGQGPRGFAYSSRLVEDGSYLRLKTVSFGYNLSARTLKRYNIKSLRFYAAAQNLITWTNYSGPDPEVSVKSSTLTPGFDYSAYPRSRTITLGINLTF